MHTNLAYADSIIRRHRNNIDPSCSRDDNQQSLREAQRRGNLVLILGRGRGKRCASPGLKLVNAPSNPVVLSLFVKNGLWVFAPGHETDAIKNLDKSQVGR